MLVLALDTSTHQASIALCTEETLPGEYTWDIGNNHSVELLQHVQEIVAACGKTLPEIDALAVATGPGSFNGTRVAVAAAKAFAFALGKPIVGVSTLDVIAAQQQWNGPICAVLEAGRSEVYAACYLNERVYDVDGEMSGRLLRLGDYMLLSPQQLDQYVREHIGEWVGVPGERTLPPVLFCGEMSRDSRRTLRELLPELSVFLSSLETTRRASTLARLARQRLKQGDSDDPLVLEPYYIRRPSITTSTRKQPLLGTQAGKARNG